MKRKNLLLSMLLAAALTLSLSGCGAPGSTGAQTQGMAIDGTDFGITIEGDNVNEESVFTSADIIYYEDMTNYPSGNLYGVGEAHERHSADEAAAHTVVNITQPGTYRISGTMEKGQIRVDLGEDAFENPEAVVTLVLDGLDIHCDVAPAILFLNVYECDNQWSADTASSNVDTAAAGANIVIADGSINNIDGGHVAKIYKDNGDEKKLWKQDGAVYSYMSMNVSGETAGDGILNVHADNEGMDTELHLTINSGMRGIFMGGATADVYIENVVIDGTIYTFNSDGGNKNYGVYISNSTLNGWTSHSDVHKEVVYTNCNFGEGQGYAFCRPYGKTVLENCVFEEGFEFDTAKTSDITFINCYYGDTLITADNAATLGNGTTTFFYNGLNGITIK